MVIGVGFIAFGGVAYNPFNVAGIALGLAGSVAYAYVKLRRR